MIIKVSMKNNKILNYINQQKHNIENNFFNQKIHQTLNL